MSRSKSSDRWLREHFSDTYVQQSKKEGYRSRASYKLLQIDEKYRLLKPHMRVIDLGSAPGGWSQVVSEKIGSAGTLIATDILPMDSFADVQFIQGDFTEESVFQRIMDATEGKGFDLVLSDMAPNLSGNKHIDQPRSMYLVELALDLATSVLNPNGALVTKFFQGKGSEELMRAARDRFKQVGTFKPDSSRARSREVFLVARGFQP